MHMGVNGFERRLEALEAAIKGQETKSRPDLTRLSAEERQDLEALRLKAGGNSDRWTLSRLTADDLRSLRGLLRKAHQMEGTSEN
jgi:hypothetical protein